MLFDFVVVAAAFVISVCKLAVLLYYGRSLLTDPPDARMYAAIRAGHGAPAPYCWRFVGALLFSGRPWLNLFLLSLTPPVVALYLLSRVGPVAAIAGAAMYCGLFGVFGVQAFFRGLVDAPALFFAWSAAVLAGIDLSSAVVCAILAGLCREPAPLFAAIAAWNPILLVGLLGSIFGVLGGMLWHRADAPSWAWWLRAPLASAREARGANPFNARVLLLPWGACLAAALHPSVQLLFAVILGYSQLLVANDAVRLYQWAALPVLASALAVLPESWLVPAVLITWFNPYARQI